MYTLLLRDKGTEDSPFFITIWPDSQRGAKQNDYSLFENYNKKGLRENISQLVHKLQKMAKTIEGDSSAYKLILETDHVNEDKHVFYSLELVDMDYSLEEDEQVVFFNDRIKSHKLDMVIRDLVKQLILIDSNARAYHRGR